MGALPTLAELRAEPVEIEDVREAVESVMAREAKILVAMDISFWMNGVEIEPEEPVNVKISAPELEGQSNLTLVHIPDAAAPEAIDLIDEDELSFALGTNEIAFRANSFSVYVVAGEEDPVPRHTYNFVDGEGNPYPFLNTAGQTVTSQIIKNGESLQEVPAPGLLDNNAFVMWVYEGGELDGQEVKFGEAITVTEDKTFTVKAFYGNMIDNGDIENDDKELIVSHMDSTIYKAALDTLIERGENVDFYKDLLAKYKKNNTLGV